MPPKEQVVCIQCGLPEEKCECEKYCCYCQSLLNIRLCLDGIYYCPDCREACEQHIAGEVEDEA